MRTREALESIHPRVGSSLQTDWTAEKASAVRPRVWSYQAYPKEGP